MTIYLIASVDNGGDYGPESTIEEDYGYFIDKTTAEAYAEELSKPYREQFDARMKEYQEKKTAWEHGKARGIAAGVPASMFAYFNGRPPSSYELPTYTVVEVKEA